MAGQILDCLKVNVRIKEIGDICVSELASHQNPDCKLPSHYGLLSLREQGELYAVLAGHSRTDNKPDPLLFG